MDTFAVKNKRIAIQLINKGFPVIDVKKSKDDETKVVHIFEDTDGFKKAFNQIVDALPSKGVTLTKFEKRFLTELLTVKQLEYKSMGVKTGTIDGIIAKLDDHAQDFKDFEKAENDRSIQDNGKWEMLNLTGIGNGKVEFANQYKIPEELKTILERQNVSAEIVNSIQKNMDFSTQYLNSGKIG